MNSKGIYRESTPGRGRNLHLIALLALVGLALVASGVAPYDRLTWFMEVLPVLVALPLLGATYRRFELTTLAYCLITMHALILIYGGAYTYARVPFGFVLQDWLQLARNPYDRIGHFVQGFIPALLAREILLRFQVVRRGGWLGFIVVCFCLALSALYELIEFAAAMLLGQGAEEFLGTQGDQWDTQWDMTLALGGACASLVLLSRWHDRQLTALRGQADEATRAGVAVRR